MASKMARLPRRCDGRVPFQKGAEGLAVPQRRRAFGQPLQTLAGEQGLNRGRLFAPQGAVVAEDGDPIFLGDEVGARGVRRYRDETQNGASGGVIPP
jgi:hypothetical protein